MAISTRWTKHLKAKADKEEFRKEVIASRHVLKVLKSLLEEDLRASQTSQESEEGYALPSWPYKQADAIGEQRAIKKVIKMITLEDRS